MTGKHVVTIQSYKTGKNKPWNVIRLFLSALSPSLVRPRAHREQDLVFIVVIAIYCPPSPPSPCWARRQALGKCLGVCNRKD